MAFTFNGIYSENMGIIVEKVWRSILPPLSHSMAEISKRPGAIHQRSKLGVREIRARIRIREASVEDLNTKIRMLAEWLYTEQPQQLMLAKEPMIFYNAVLDGDTNLEELVRVGKGELRFLCPDPLAYNSIESLRVVPSNVQTHTFTVDGTYKTFPIVKATFKQDASFFMYSNGREYEQVIYGQPQSDEKTMLPQEQNVLVERFDDITDWQAGSVVENGQVQGTMAANTSGSGYTTYDTFGIQPSSSLKWYGPAIKKSLAEPLENWRVEFNINFQDLDAKYMGRIELYLLDVNGAIMGRLSMYDRYTGTSRAEAKISLGPDGNRKDLINSAGDNPGVWNKFYGTLQLVKVGKQYTAFVGVFDTGTGKYHSRMTGKWYDADNQFSAKQLSQVQLHVGAYGSALIFPKNNIYADNLRVYKRNVVEETTEVPGIIAAGDVVEFDHSRKLITKNGIPFKQPLNPISDMFPLYPGENVIGFEPYDAADVEISFRSRWL